MKIKSLKYIIFLGCFSLIFLGCSKSFLDLTPESNANASDFFQTEEDMELAVNNAYVSLYTIYGPLGGVSFCGEQMSDECYTEHGTGSLVDKWQFRDYTLEPSNTFVYQFWQDFYNALFDVNIVLSKIDGAGIAEDTKNGIIAEMKFLRALYYFNMVRMWGGVPLVTKPIENFQESYDFVRSSADEVYAQIVKDLQEAIPYLPLASNVSAKGKVSKGAAQTLLGKVYLTLGDKTSASTVLLEVYNSHEYQLLDNYTDLWVLENKNTLESIFEIQVMGGSGNPSSTYFPAFQPYENFVISGYSEGMNMVTQLLYDSYEPTDPRRDISIGELAWHVTPLYPIKWTDATVAFDQAAYSANNFMVLRYADVLLMLTEATGQASYMNEVRQRVGLPGFGEAGYPTTYSNLNSALEHERMVELALEFHRWFDLKRLGSALSVLSDAKGKTLTENNMLLPIPYQVRQKTPNVTQNPGYN